MKEGRKDKSDWSTELFFPHPPCMNEVFLPSSPVSLKEKSSAAHPFEQDRTGRDGTVFCLSVGVLERDRDRGKAELRNNPFPLLRILPSSFS